jgi:ligand-binding sensor domain-containing protein
MLLRYLNFFPFLLIVVSFIPIGFGADTSEIDTTDFRFFTRMDGLISDTVFCISTDSSGALWFGTDKGISTFDGIKWTNYPKFYDSEFKSINAIAIDSLGRVWCGSNGGGITMFDGKQWKNYYHEAFNQNSLISNFVTSIAIDSNGIVWIGTEKGISVFDGFKWKNFTTNDGIIYNHIRSVLIDENGNKWFGSEKGLSRFDDTCWTNLDIQNITTIFFSDNLLNNMVQDNKGNIWFTIGKGVTSFNCKNWQQSTIEKLRLEAGSPVISMAIDINGDIWMGTNGCGIIYYNGKNFHKLNSLDKHNLGNINSVFIDKKGNIWFATFNGLLMIG